jgi:polar amino acid transport system ATP-binding protein
MSAVDNGKTQAGAAAPPMLDVIDVWKSFAGVDVLRGFDLEVAPGQVMCLLGPSGSGKSTLLRCINHLTGIDAGRITVAGQLIGYDEQGDTLTEAPEHVVTVRRRAIGTVFQHFNLFPHMGALDNVAAGPVHTGMLGKSAARDLAFSLLAKVGLADKCDAYPAQLSGGQKQRVAIARALAMNPRLMLFD